MKQNPFNPIKNKIQRICSNLSPKQNKIVVVCLLIVFTLLNCLVSLSSVISSKKEQVKITRSSSVILVHPQKSLSTVIDSIYHLKQ